MHINKHYIPYNQLVQLSTHGKFAQKNKGKMGADYI